MVVWIVLVASACKPTEPAGARPPPDMNSRFLGVSQWVGTYSVRSSSKGERSLEGLTEAWDRTMWSWGIVELEHRAPLRSALGPAPVFHEARFQSTLTTESGSQVERERCSGSGSLAATLEFSATGQYRLSFSDVFAPCEGSITLDGQEIPAGTSVRLTPPAEKLFVSLPTEGLKLSETVTFSTDDETGHSTDWVVQWNLAPRNSEAELLLEAEGYDAWRPLAFVGTLPADELPPVGVTTLGSSLLRAPKEVAPGPQPMRAGATLRLRALVIPIGPFLPKKAARISFVLRSSKVPGVAMNSPLSDGEASPQDIQFEREPNETLGLTFVSKDRVETPAGEYTQAAADLSSFDFGAYGEVTAIAEMADGTLLVAKVRDEGDSFHLLPLRIPKRAPDSFVADVWKRENGAMALADSYDGERLPGGGGDGHAGDGLTLYEEYRGFIADGSWFSTNPETVDYFLYNELEGDAVAGINLFKRATRLQVHAGFNFSSGDFDPTTRVANFNALHDGGRHRVDQHLVMLTRSSQERRRSQTQGGPSTPKHAGVIELAREIPPRELANTVAHELGHSVDIPHHGEGARRDVAWRKQPDGRFLEVPGMDNGPAGDVVTFKQEGTGFGLTLPDSLPAVIVSTAHGGLFSGDETCFMRYASARAVIRSGERSVRYFLLQPEPLGTTLCSDGKGKTFNSDGLYPDGTVRTSRHGDAAPKRGDCVHHVCVNDAHGHPPRNAP